MLEVLVTIVILAFGMLGLAGMQSKIFTAEMESYQRAQAVVLMNDMVERINANRYVAANYIPTTTLGCSLGAAADPQCHGETTYGTATAQTGDCAPKAAAAFPPGDARNVLRDQCEWSNALKGAAETSGAGKVGGMIGAVGCITQLQPQVNSPTCQPGIYLVSVAWQGLNATSSPSTACGQNFFGGDDRLRRALSARVSIGLANCQ